MCQHLEAFKFSEPVFCKWHYNSVKDPLEVQDRPMDFNQVKNVSLMKFVSYSNEHLSSFGVASEENYP